MLSKSALSAVKAFTFLAEQPGREPVGAQKIAEEISAPSNYLGKLLQSFAREGLVISQKGLGGGFRLARPADRITLLEVVEPIDRVARWEGCFLGRNSCNSDNPCAVHHDWKRVRDSYLDFLRRTTIADLAREPDLLVKAS
jgi:Rrf2 family protein